jgi:hypothetical protein
LSALAVGGLVGASALLHPGRAAVGTNPASDFQVMTWSLGWWPWAIGHGVNPLHTDLLWPPAGFSTLWMTTIPVPALFALPITMTFGPLVAYNVLILLAVPLASAAAYLLCWELTHRFSASLLGGLLFGLSPYMLGHTLSQHLDLTFVFPVPLLALLAVRYLHGKTSGRRFVVGFAALLLLELGSSFELFVDLTLIVTLAIVFSFLGEAGRRKEFARLRVLVGVSYAACLPVLVPIAVLALRTSHARLRYAPRNYAIDLFNLVVPTATLMAGKFHLARVIAQHFVGNIGEQDGYLGLPLLVITLLALRAQWRRGAWLAAALFASMLALSFGPELTANGLPLLSLPWRLTRVPLLQSLLPARMSLFYFLAAACLCALWFARPHRASLQVAAAVLLIVSLLPNFRPAHRLLRAWSISDAFAWSTPHVPQGFVRGNAWRRVIQSGSTVLVLPAADRTAASFWQLRSGMRFALAVPATPFVPPQRAAEPMVRALTNDQPPSLAAARLRAFLISDRVGTVVVTASAKRRWGRIVAAATQTTPVVVASTELYRVPTGLPRLIARQPVQVTPVAGDPLPSFVRHAMKVWLRFDGRRAELQVLLRSADGEPNRTTLSSPRADADMPAAATDAHGDAALIFTEWNEDKQRLQVATRFGNEWRLATLDETRQPIWSPRIIITPRGATLATWIDETDPTRSIRAAVLPRGRRWSRPITLENGDGLGSVALGVGDGNLVVLAWHDGIDTESRVRAEIYANGRWTPTVTLAHSLALLEHVRITGPDATGLSWRLVSLTGVQSGRFDARRKGNRWLLRESPHSIG